MSRIGREPVIIPDGVEVTIKDSFVKVKGPVGSLERDFHHTVAFTKEGSKVTVNLRQDTKSNRRYFGLSRTLLANMVHGCSKGFAKKLKFVGVGYRAAPEGKGLKLTIGYSNPVIVDAVEGIDFKVEKNTNLTIFGASKEKVGQVSADIRSLRPPEPYHGKGITYDGEKISLKVGKAAGKK